jgi:hypothetical protein
MSGGFRLSQNKLFLDRLGQVMPGYFRLTQDTLGYIGLYLVMTG